MRDGVPAERDRTIAGEGERGSGRMEEGRNRGGASGIDEFAEP